MKSRVGLAWGLGALLSACAGPSLLMLPTEDGHPGAVAVLDAKGGETLVDRPLTETRLTRGKPSTRAVTSIGKERSRLISGLPPRAVGFILYFDQGMATITPESRGVLDQIKAEIARRSGADVQVTGHTDTVDSVEVNDRLSERRAQEIVQLLIADGFPPDILSAVGRGERELLVETPDNTPNAGNRRVEVIVR
jgi:outer membrane protein OmpA-like peptidoglycan-associated protein